MPRLNLPSFRIGNLPVTFKPSYEHFGDPAADGDLHVDFDVDGHLSEDDRYDALWLTNRVSGNYLTINEAKLALFRARRQSEAANAGA